MSDYNENKRYASYKYYKKRVKNLYLHRSEKLLMYANFKQGS